MAGERQRDTLQTIFSFFLGLMVVAFIGVGVNTFYQSPTDTHQQELQSLLNEQSSLQARGTTNLTAADQDRITTLQKQIDSLQTRIQAEQQIWARNTSIVLVLFATVVMGISLIRSEQLRVLSNGLLLGGLFTMIYGAGWTIFGGTSTVRFFVVLFALAVTIGLGYAKFVHARSAGPLAAAPQGAVPTAALGSIESRLAALETRLGAAASILGGSPEERSKRP